MLLYSFLSYFSFQSDGGSPFGRWAGNGSGRILSHRSYRRPGSLVTSEHDMYTKVFEKFPPT